MRENRPYGSEGGEGQTLPDPYQAPHRTRNPDDPAARTAAWIPGSREDARPGMTSSSFVNRFQLRPS
jgi:hypothetical protein